MSGPAWECNPERLKNGRIVYRCMFAHFHSDKGAAWSCGGPYDHESKRMGADDAR